MPQAVTLSYFVHYSRKELIILPCRSPPAYPESVTSETVQQISVYGHSPSDLSAATSSILTAEATAESQARFSSVSQPYAICSKTILAKAHKVRACQYMFQPATAKVKLNRLHLTNSNCQSLSLIPPRLVTMKSFHQIWSQPIIKRLLKLCLVAV